jgi:hypothetical protein
MIVQLYAPYFYGKSPGTTAGDLSNLVTAVVVSKGDKNSSGSRVILDIVDFTAVDSVPVSSAEY